MLSAEEGTVTRTPQTVSPVLCETLITDEHSGNPTLVNCFMRRRVRHLPSEAVSFVVVAFLTEGQGDIDMEVVIQRADNFDEVYRRQQRARFDNPLEEYRLSWRIVDLSFPVAGLYQVWLVAGGDVIGHKTFQVTVKGSAS